MFIVETAPAPANWLGAALPSSISGSTENYSGGGGGAPGGSSTSCIAGKGQNGGSSSAGQAGRVVIRYQYAKA